MVREAAWTKDTLNPPQVGSELEGKKRILNNGKAVRGSFKACHLMLNHVAHLNKLL